MRCPKCQYDNPEGKKFCRKCGAELSLTCPQCGAEILSDDRFCGDCGRDLQKPQESSAIDYNQPESYTPRHLADKILTTRSSMEGERKLVTVLFADVADFTSMSEKLDPEEVHEIMDGCFRILMDEIHKYEGTINQFTGDGVMALFGAPVAHEDHAQRACRAALSVQKTLGEYGDRVRKDYGVAFKMRMGLNSGPVIVGAIGDDLRMDYTAVGDTTNLASRMEGLSPPGGVMVSRNTYRLAKDYFEFHPLGKIKVKGKEEPQEAFELIRTGEVETRIGASVARGLTRFVGRRNSMAGLMEAYEKAKAGSGQVVGVVGEAGVGKSRLLLEFRKGLPQKAFSYLEGRCLQYGGAMAYLPLLDILRSCLDIREGDRERIIKKKIAEKTVGLDSKLSGTVPPFQELLSLKVDDEAYLRLEPQQRRQRTFESIRDLLIRKSQETVLVMAIEDLHWIDRTSEDFLDYLIGWLANAHILLILLYRPEYNHPWGSKSYYNRIGVDQLTIQSSGELVQAVLEGTEVEAELKELILSRAAGNPLFMEEFTHSLLENGSIERRENRYVLNREPSDIQVPDTIQGIIAARIDRLEESLKRIMQVASVIGREFAFRILQTITGMREELKSHLLNLQGLEFIHEKALFPELEYIFKHALTQEVAYNSLLVQRRKEIHGKIGRAMEEIYPERREELCEILAHHYVLSGNREKAVEYLDLANQRATDKDAALEAKAYFDRAMKILEDLPETRTNQARRITLLTNQSNLHQRLSKMSEYYDLLTRYEPVARGLGDQAILGRFYGRLGVCEWWFGRLDQAIERSGKACELLETMEKPQELGLVNLGLQWAHLYRGDFGGVLVLKETILRLLAEHPYPRAEGLAFIGASWACFFKGRWEQAVEEGENGLRVGEKYEMNHIVSFAAFALSNAYTLRGDLSRAIEYAELGIQKATTVAERLWAQSGLQWAHARIGDPAIGVELGKSLAPMYRAAHFVPGETFTLINTAEGILRCGDRNDAAKKCREGLKLAQRSGMKFAIGHGHRLLGETSLEVNPDEAHDHFTKSMTVFEEIGAENELALAYSGYGRLHKKQGDIPQAREYLTRALEILERLGTLIEPDRVRKELDDLRRG